MPKEKEAPPEDDTIDVDPRSFDAEDDYRWDRKYLLGEQVGTIVRCKKDKWPSGDSCVAISIGFKGPEGGVKIDRRMNPLGAEWKLFLAAFSPAHLRGGKLSLGSIVGHAGMVTVSESWDENKQQNYPRIGGFAPISGGQAQAPAKAPGADL